MKQDTKLVRMGRGEAVLEGMVNLPVHRASTILSPDLQSYLDRYAGDSRFEKITYAANGSQNSRALAETVASLEGGCGSVITSTGLSAVSMTLSALLQHGDHVLVTDSVYGPTRRFCDDVLTRYGIETSYFDPLIADIETAIRSNTRLLYLEAPGSLTFEMQDVPALAAAARSRGVLVAMDNTWATPLCFKPLDHGVDISIQAGTKYLAGHSDLVIGVVTAASDELYRQIADHVMNFGDTAGPDDCYLALRGMRTMAVRLRHQFDSALKVAGWLSERAEVKRVLYPPLPGDPGHDTWRKDYSGGASLFGLVLHSAELDAVARMVDNLELFNIGSSWGGYESLVAVNKAPLPRVATPWNESPFLLRLHIGLEHPDDLIGDLEQGLARL